MIWRDQLIELLGTREVGRARKRVSEFEALTRLSKPNHEKVILYNTIFYQNTRLVVFFLMKFQFLLTQTKYEKVSDWSRENRLLGQLDIASLPMQVGLQKLTIIEILII
jgi:hypothetical protein